MTSSSVRKSVRPSVRPCICNDSAGLYILNEQAHKDRTQESINDSRYYFNFELPSELLVKRKDKFIEKFMASQCLLDYFAIQ